MFHFNSIFLHLFILTGMCISSSTFCQVANKKNKSASSPVSKDTVQQGKNNGIPNFPTAINSKSNRNTSKSLTEYISDKFRHIQVCSGEIYFSGAGFPYVERLLYVGCGQHTPHSISPALKQLYGRCRKGTEITFIKFTIKNSNGSISKPVNRTVRII